MLTIERVIHAARNHVWDFLGDLEAWAGMLPTVDEIERVDGVGPIAVGSRFRVRQPGLAEATYEITEWQPGRAFTWQAPLRGVRTVATHHLRDHDSGSELTLGIAWHGPLAGPVRLTFRRKTLRFLDAEAATLARLAEARP
ncbi:SRPBCC family protein [Isoptericola sp. BMS4]|uniref:SRPBCC family protein n=1 Tax=Isoptericola sp. BMS4 TaxID=2527875 RepID=UPI001422ECAF|nr:SRPBCC family protein [Isoptericola sp. BMS4]